MPQIDCQITQRETKLIKSLTLLNIQAFGGLIFKVGDLMIKSLCTLPHLKISDSQVERGLSLSI